MTRRKKTARSSGPAPWLIILPLLAVALSGFAIYKGIQYYLRSSDYFLVREVSAVGIADDRYVQMIRDELKGANIFKVEVIELAQRIRRKFPTFYDVRVRRILPSELRIVAEERVPVAVVYKGHNYLFDVEGVALATVASPEAVGLPLVEGVAGRLPKIRTGFRYGFSNLRKALRLAAAIEGQGKHLVRLMPAGDQRVSRIVVGSNGQLSLYLGTDLEVKVRDRRFDEQLDLLPAILRNLGSDIGMVAYLDLRPREPVVRMKAGRKQR